MYNPITTTASTLDSPNASAGSDATYGVTSVIMGNCGFTLAPGSAKQREMIVANIVRAELRQ